ncbi:hypothetical protein HMPREF9714_03359 [Myroides odoratimimus CCUG 12901]|uniref:hypothetical protein n=1 Tax=Myroides odoratimimus TaxID=76832 RepID=UPI000246115E|nr:hypothetical protein [Myroides odoratimimus]EHO05421.1 hypothetical protein HMPREF9714_03359 [Myroides odoratimimus CCUG 12901]
MLNKFLDLLWKCKPLFKLYVFLDFTFRKQRVPKWLKLRKSRYFVNINGQILYFDPKSFTHYANHDHYDEY